MSSSCTVRPAAASELDRLAELHAACFAEAWDADAFATLLAMPGAFALLAEEPARDAPSGFAASGFLMIRGVGDEAEIITLGVLAERRRNGVGRDLLAGGIKESASRGVHRLFLEVAADNNEALALYRAAGFTQIGKRANYYHRSDGDMAALVMARDITIDSSDPAPNKN
jgi:ribosomal-protein-alanine N-acetyltransferase